MKYYHWLIIVAVSFVIGYCRGIQNGIKAIAKSGKAYFYYSPNQIIGQTSTLDGIEITENSIWGDFKEIERAKRILGNNWRIATIEELKRIAVHRNSIISRIEDTFYWSSDINPRNNKENLQYDFSTGEIRGIDNGDKSLAAFPAQQQFAILVRDIE